MKLLMAISQYSSAARQCTLILAAAPLLFALAGCLPPIQAPPPKPRPAATAPAVKPQETATQTQPDAQQTVQLIAATQHAQKVQALISKAEESYKSGVANYNANHLDAARQDFDFAVDTMLSSGMDLKNDPQLSEEFDQLLSAINSLELIALREGNGFSPKLEEAPVEAAADEVTFAPDPVLVKKVTAELKTTQSDFPLVINDYVAGWISAYTDKPALHAHLKRSLERRRQVQGR